MQSRRPSEARKGWSLVETDVLLQVDEERKLRSALDRAAERREADFKELQLREKNLQV